MTYLGVPDESDSDTQFALLSTTKLFRHSVRLVFQVYHVEGFSDLKKQIKGKFFLYKCQL